MDCITTFPATANASFSVILLQPKRPPDAILAEIHAELRRRNHDADRAAELLQLGVDILRRRQREQGAEGGGR